MSRVEILSSDDEDEGEAQPPQQSIKPKKGDVVGVAAGPVGPPKPPPGVVLKRAGKKKTGAAPVVDPKPALFSPSVAGFSPVVASAPIAAQTDRNEPPPVADSDSDDDSDDLVFLFFLFYLCFSVVCLKPPPLEPMPFAAAEASAQKKAMQKLNSDQNEKNFPKPAKAVVLPTTTTTTTTATTATKQPAVIGPPKPSSSKKDKETTVSTNTATPASEVSATGRPSYVDRDLLEFPLFMTELPKVKKKEKNCFVRNVL
jgi:hypothetical protein